MDFSFDTTTQALISRARRFVDEHVLPAEPVLEQQLAATPDEWTVRPIVRDLQQRARAEGLWNLFLPAGHGENGGAGLTNLQYAPIAEITATRLT